MMSLTIHQSISINFLKVQTITNSSFLQIGSSGSIQALSNFNHSGQFSKPSKPVPQNSNEIQFNIPIIPII